MKVFFVGPSLHGHRARLSERHPELVLRPPAVRGDVARAVLDGAGAIGLVDGCFGATQSVWHKEILFALERGISVGGGASMGALRAAECDSFGMRGIGSIYHDYKSGNLCDDEEVSLVHAPAELDWMPLSVPWVNFAATVLYACESGTISPNERNLLMIAGRQLHFTERTFRKAVDLCRSMTEHCRASLSIRIAEKIRDRKREDAWQVAGWLDALPLSGATSRPSWTLARTSHWRVLESEIAMQRDPPLDDLPPGSVSHRTDLADASEE